MTDFSEHSPAAWRLYWQEAKRSAPSMAEYMLRRGLKSRTDFQVYEFGFPPDFPPCQGEWLVTRKMMDAGALIARWWRNQRLRRFVRLCRSKAFNEAFYGPQGMGRRWDERKILTWAAS